MSEVSKLCWTHQSTHQCGIKINALFWQCCWVFTGNHVQSLNKMWEPLVKYRNSCLASVCCACEKEANSYCQIMFPLLRPGKTLMLNVRAQERNHIRNYSLQKLTNLFHGMITELVCYSLTHSLTNYTAVTHTNSNTRGATSSRSLCI